MPKTACLEPETAAAHWCSLFGQRLSASRRRTYKLFKSIGCKGILFKSIKRRMWGCVLSPPHQTGKPGEWKLVLRLLSKMGWDIPPKAVFRLWGTPKISFPPTNYSGGLKARRPACNKTCFKGKVKSKIIKIRTCA